MKISFFTVVTLIISLSFSQISKSQKVEFKNKEQDKRVEVFVGGKLFTAFIYPDDMGKQSLYQIITTFSVHECPKFNDFRYKSM